MPVGKVVAVLRLTAYRAGRVWSLFYENPLTGHETD